VSITKVVLDGIDAFLFPVQTWTFSGLNGVANAPFHIEIFGAVTGQKPQWSGELTIAQVPEPSAYALLATGILFVALYVRRRVQSLE
jgi:hypothetical protein